MIVVRRAGPFFLLTLSLLASTHCAAAAADRARLRALLTEECGSCHGLTLRGGLGRPLTPDALANFPVETVRDIILDGLPGTPMPPWRPLLSEEEAATLADIIKRGDMQ